MMGNKLFLVFFSIVIFTGFGFYQNAEASTNYIAVQNGNWNNPATWGGISPPIIVAPTDTLRIPTGITVTIPSGVSVTIQDGSFCCNRVDGILNIDSGGSFTTDRHSFFVNGELNNYGTFDVKKGFGSSTGRLNNYNLLMISENQILSVFGILNNYGSITGSGSISIAGPGKLFNFGTVDLPGTIVVLGTLVNSGNLSSHGIIYTVILSTSNWLGLLDNQGTLNNFNELRNNGHFINNGIFNNFSLLNNRPAEDPFPAGIIDNNNIINNEGTITNSATFNNFQTINNSCDAVYSGNPLIGNPITDVCIVDTDGDGVADDVDNCPSSINPDQADVDVDGIGDVCDDDNDNDGILDLFDNCPFTSNVDQTNTDGDEQGDACDVDDDNDFVFDSYDLCPTVPGSVDGCPDEDNDGVADISDNCNLYNPDQADINNDGIGDVCQDQDSDGVLDPLDQCPTIPGSIDGCPDTIPIADASSDISSGLIPISVQFVCNASSGNNPLFFSWDFGDGELSAEQNPSHVYTTADHFTATCIVTDSNGDTSTSSVGITAENPSIQAQKSDQIIILQSLIDDAPKKTQKELYKAIKEIQNSLDNKLWEDEISLDSKHGNKVFDREKEAVKSLMKIEKDDDSTDVTDVIDVLVAVDRQLASDAFDEANTPENQSDKKSKKELDKSDSELTKGDEKRDDGKYDKAIDHYKKAWKHAQKAMKHQVSDNDNDEENEDDDD